jgi:hypothetical protein
MPAKLILIVALLTTESSYKDVVERPSAGVSDTVQFYIGGNETWRIRTYAIDHDIHTYSIGTPDAKSTMTVDQAKTHIEQHYADILKKLEIIELDDFNDSSAVRAALTAQGLNGEVEVGGAGIAFYNPDNARYWTQSSP